MYIDNQWELIGTTTIDLSDYVTETELATALTPYVQTSALTTTLDDRYVNITGDTMTGELTINGLNGGKINLIQSQADFGKTVTLSAKRERSEQSEYKSVLSVNTQVAADTPYLENHLTTKGYVDSKINAVTSTIPTISAASALTTGITTGTITINGTTTTFYAPESKDTVYYVEMTIEADPENEGQFIASFVNDDTFESISERIENGENVKVRASGLILDCVERRDNDYIRFSQLVTLDNSDSQFIGIEIYPNDGIYVCTSELSPVAFSGDYNDLINAPTPSSVIVTQGITSGFEIGTITVNGNTTTFYFDQANWETANASDPSYIWNKPPIWHSKEYTVPSGQTYGDSNKKAVAAIIANRSDNSAKGNYSWTEGKNTIGNHTINVNGTAITIPYGSSGNYSHTEGNNNSAVGECSHVEGNSNVAYGIESHAEGQNTIAYGYYSHAENADTKALGNFSHAEGNNTTASGNTSHAEGNNTTASGSTSHAEGSNTISQRRSQHVFGEYNIADSSGSTNTRGTYVEIIGNGSAESSRSNARTLDWSGNEWLAGKVTVANLTPTADGDLTTKQYVDNAVAGITVPTKTSDLTNDSGFIKQFLVTVTKNGDAYSSDKTLAEITAADTNGYEVICHCVNDGSYLKLLSLSVEFAMFQLFGSNINGPASETIRIDSDGNIEHRFDHFPGEVLAISNLSTGTEIGSITVDGTTTTLYAPNIDNKLSIGYISENSLFVPNNTGYRYGSGGDYTGIFYFVVPSEPAPLMNTANKTISQIRIIGTNNYADISPSKKFTEPGLYRGYVSDNSFMYEKVGSSAPTYTLSMTGPTINLLADGVAASTITLPIYDGTVALADAAVVG